ncbi:MAG: primase [Clostridia bacterium]|nr:primase [Clostridia bacterium]
MAYPEEILEEIKARLDIVEVVREYVRLERRGRNFVGLCPFHSEKTASFTVSPEKQIFYCFGCGVGGDIFTFIRKIDNLDFPEAVRRLADKAGVRLPQEKGSFYNEQQWSQRQRLYQMHALAAKFYSLVLRGPEGEKARNYIRTRGIGEEIAKKFQLGYAPETPQALIKYLKGEGFQTEEILLAGLAVEREGGIHDRFRNRLMFPIWDHRGRVIGFGGRVLDAGLPKYVNSPETLLFRKGYHLYALHLASEAIRQQGFALIVEGYMDAIAAHEAGIENAVATMGTAFTPQQAKELRRFTSEAVIAYDADAAGQAATLRGLSILQEAGVKVRVLELPEGLDPDDFLKCKGARAFNEMVAGASSLIAYRLEQAIKTYGLRHEHSLAKVVAEVVPDIARIENAVERDGYIRLISKRIALPEQSIYEEVKKYIHKKDKEVRIRHTIAESKHNFIAGPDVQETFLLSAYIHDPALAQMIEGSLGEDFWECPECKFVRDEIKKLRFEKPGLAGDVLINLLEKEIGVASGLAIIARLKIQSDARVLFTPEAVKEAINRVRARNLHRLIKTKEQELAQAEISGAGRNIKELQEEIFRLQQELRLVRSGKEGVNFERGTAAKAANC